MSQEEATSEAILVERLKVFLRCRGTVGDYREFEELPDEVVAALARASYELDVERALLFASAVRNSDGTLRVASILDGGDSFVRSKLSEACARYVARRSDGGSL